jgi:hypothetical protein
VQQTQVFLAGPLRLLGQQRVVRLPKTASREQIRLIAILRERPRLAHQPANDVAIVDAMLVMATQTRHYHHDLLRVAHLDLFRADPGLHPFTPQPRRHRVDVVEHADRAPMAHLHAPPLQGFQPPARQRPQHRQLLDEARLPARILLGHDSMHKRRVLFPTAKVALATHEQGLVQRPLELPMTLLAIPVFVATRRVGRLADQTIMAQKCLVLSREHFQVAVGMHRQRQAIGAVPRRYPAQGPQRVLQALAEAGETLRKTQRQVFPIRVGQHKMVGQMRERLPLDGYAQARQVGEVRGSQTPGLMHLREKYFLGRSRRGAPNFHPPL